MDPEELNADQGGAAPEPVIETQEPAADPAASTETPAPEGAEAEAGEAAPQPEAPKHKVPQSVQKRIDKLSYDAKSAQERAEAAEARAQALEALLTAQGGDVPAPDAKPSTQTDIEKAAAELLARQTFDQKCNDTFAKGSEAFGKEGFSESLGMLQALGVMSVDFLQAALETAAPEKVLHTLGQDPDEAVRIASLPPIRQAIELDRMATKLAAPAKPQISKVPAPINPLDGSGKGAPDIYDPNLPDEDYYKIREKERAARFGG